MSNDNGTYTSTSGGIFGRILRFYVDGFRSMTIGKSLWLLIIVKVIFLLLLMKIFFFPNVLKESYDTDRERAEAVRQHLTDTSAGSQDTEEPRR